MTHGGETGGDKREGRRTDLPFIENNGAKMAPIGTSISQVAAHLSPHSHFPGES